MTTSRTLGDGGRVRKARTVRRVAPVVAELAAALAAVPELTYVKLFPERLSASNRLSQDGKQNPVVKIGADGLVGVELLIDTAHRVVQFYAITSAVPGAGRRMVEAVVGVLPADWQLVVLLDWSGGFWERMTREHPRILVC
jgi:hypothetical protein